MQDLLQKINRYADTVEETDILKQDLAKLREVTLKVLKDFRNWLKVVGKEKVKNFWVKGYDSKKTSIQE